ncbi:MAG: hypothetical protein AB1607_09565 [Chloroflexota bacterium]
MNADSQNRFALLFQENRKVILLEILFMALLIWIGIPPSTTIYLLLLAWLLLRLRGRFWRDIGLRAPERWNITLLLGIGGGLLYFFFSKLGDCAVRPKPIRCEKGFVRLRFNGG